MPSLDWIGKKAVINYHMEAPFHLLRFNAELSAGEPERGRAGTCWLYVD